MRPPPATDSDDDGPMPSREVIDRFLSVEKCTGTFSPLAQWMDSDGELLESKGLPLDQYLAITGWDFGDFESDVLFYSREYEGINVRIAWISRYCGWPPYLAAILLGFQSSPLAELVEIVSLTVRYISGEKELEVVHSDTHGTVGRLVLSTKLLTPMWAFSYVWSHRISPNVFSLDKIQRPGLE